MTLYLYILNVWQEISDAFTNGIQGLQLWGGIAGVLIFILLILKPILQYVQENSRRTQTAPLSLTHPELHRLFILEETARNKKKIRIKDCYIVKQAYKVDCLIFIKNVDLTQTDMNRFVKLIVELKISESHVLCNNTELDKILIRRANENLKSTSNTGDLIKKELIQIHILNRAALYRLFNPDTLRDVILTKQNL